ncbi:MAG: flagellar basal body-associated FliL family protein [Asticcacaulis sp.]
MAKTKDKKKEAEAPPPEVEEGAEGEAAPKKKKGPPILIIAIAAGVLVLGGGGAGAYFMFLAPKVPPAATDKKAEKKPEKKKEDKKEGAAAKPDPKTQPTVEDGPDGVKYFKMPDVVANIQSPDGHASYLKLKLTFECDDDTADLLSQSMPRVNDILQGFMGELRPEDISSSAGDMQLRQEILRRINLILAPHKINAVLIEQKLLT